MGAALADVVLTYQFLGWLAGLFVAWGVLSLLFRSTRLFGEKPRGSAHKVVIYAPFFYLAGSGCQMWFLDGSFRAAFASDRVYGDYGPAYALAVMMAAFQVWDFIVTSVTPELCKVQHLVHHGATGALAFIGLMNGPHGFLLYYGAFFFGVCELSSIPLSAVDLFRMNKDLAVAYPAINEACRVTFAVLFLSFRCLYWPFVSFDFWRSTLTSGAPASLLALWYVANISLTLLQYYWGWLILKGVMKMLKGDKSGRELETEAREPARESLLRVACEAA